MALEINRWVIHVGIQGSIDLANMWDPRLDMGVSKK